MVECQQRLISQQQENCHFIASTIRDGLALPHADMMVFTGDPLEYWTFFTFFDNNIERRTESDSERLTYLLQYCSGKVKEAIKSCAALDPALGYKEARSILSRIFGEPYHIATAHVNQLTNGPVIKAYDGSALLGFSMQLKSCVNTLTAIGYLNDINSSDNLRRIVERLPFYIRTKWLSRTRYLRSMASKLGVKELCEFIEEQAEEANDPVFGDILLSKPKVSSKPDQASKSFPRKYVPQSATRAVSTMVTQGTRVTQEQRQQPQESQHKQEKCPACEGLHILQRCYKFKDMTNDERVKILMRDHICFNCFTKGHYAVGCAQPPACAVNNCKSKHQSIMHRSSQSTSTKETESRGKDSIHNQVEKSQSNQGQNNAIGAGSSVERKVFLKVVPVKIMNHHGQYVETYALLDTGSDVTLCDVQLLTDLQLDSTEKSLLLTTQEARNSYRVGRETSLTVQSMDSTTTLVIPRVWAIGLLNVSESRIPTKEEITAWSHLQDIDVSNLPTDREVRLLIGCNVPRCLLCS